MPWKCTEHQSSSLSCHDDLVVGLKKKVFSTSDPKEARGLLTCKV